MKVAVHKENK